MAAEGEQVRRIVILTVLLLAVYAIRAQATYPLKPSSATVTVVPTGPSLQNADGKTIFSCRGWWKDCYLANGATLDDVMEWIRQDHLRQDKAD